MAQINLGEGKWLVGDCGKMPSEKNCKLMMAAPEAQREDLLNAAVAHAVKDHGHQDTPETREEVNKTLSVLE